MNMHVPEGDGRRWGGKAASDPGDWREVSRRHDTRNTERETLVSPGGVSPKRGLSMRLD